MASEIPSLLLNDGNRMPMAGLGVYKTSGDFEMQQALNAALDAGCRLIDTASVYKNEENVTNQNYEPMNEILSGKICPYCGKPTTVGDTVMISGFVGCNNCYWDKADGLLATVLRIRETDYAAYAKGDFYREGYKGWKRGGTQGKRHTLFCSI